MMKVSDADLRLWNTDAPAPFPPTHTSEDSSQGDGVHSADLCHPDNGNVGQTIQGMPNFG